MLTNNFIYALSNSFDVSHNMTSEAGSNGDSTAIDKLFNSSNWPSSTIKIGTGTTLPTGSDYCLENAITSGYSITTKTKSLITYGDKNAIAISAIITNTSDSDIAFSEIGYVAANVWNPSQGYKTMYLLAREVFDEPVVIEPGGSQAVSIRISL